MVTDDFNKKTLMSILTSKNISDIVSNNDILNLIEKMLEAYKEQQITKKEVAKINVQKEILINDIIKRFDLYYYIFNKIFAERNNAIEKSFEIIDKGIKENDHLLISSGLQSLTTVVTSSPFTNIQELRSILENGKCIEL